MATYYVGPGGNDANSGLTWALRKLTLNGAEDIPVAAGDIVYVGSGVYREQLTCDVSGGAGNYITYIADVTGEHTDGVGGIVRITGSDNDIVGVRNFCIFLEDKDYRIFRGFQCDLNNSGAAAIRLLHGQHIVFEDCSVEGVTNDFYIDGTTQLDITIRRCLLYMGRSDYCIRYVGSSDVSDAGHVVENCLFLGYSNGIATDRVGGVTIRNCTFIANYAAVRILTALAVGQVWTVDNSIISACLYGVRAINLGEIVEDFNSFWNNATDRTVVAVGANSNAYPPLWAWPVLYAGAGQVSGYKFPWIFSQQSEWSLLRAITGSSERAVDLFGIPRPATPAKNSWGAVQFHDAERDTAITHEASAASIVLNDAARYQMWVPVDATATTISVYVYREANYAGNLPQMIVKQPGQADTVVTDVGAAGGWNLLTTTLTPATLPQYVLVELVSRNTAAAGNYATYFDDLVVA